MATGWDYLIVTGLDGLTASQKNEIVNYAERHKKVNITALIKHVQTWPTTTKDNTATLFTLLNHTEEEKFAELEEGQILEKYKTGQVGGGLWRFLQELNSRVPVVIMMTVVGSMTSCC